MVILDIQKTLILAYQWRNDRRANVGLLISAHTTINDKLNPQQPVLHNAASVQNAKICYPFILRRLTSRTPPSLKNDFWSLPLDYCPIPAMIDLTYITQTDPHRFVVKPGQQTMKAVLTTGTGGYDKLDYTDVPIPVPGPDDVLLKVLAAGVNNTEINTRLGWYSSSVTDGTQETAQIEYENEIADGGWNAATPFPIIQGTDCCGGVVTMGENVRHLTLGTRVLVRACMRQFGFHSPENIWMASDFDGAFAEFVRVPASEVFAIDCDWSNEALATIPCAYATAENMVHRCQVKAGDRVLVPGASGGVGSAVVQLVQRRGAIPIAVVAGSKVEQARDMGVETVIPRGEDLVEALGESSVDVVIDNVAGEGFGVLLKILKRMGRYASSGAIAGPMVELDMRDFYLKDITLIGCTAWDEPVFTNLVSYIERGELHQRHPAPILDLLL